MNIVGYLCEKLRHREALHHHAASPTLDADAAPKEIERHQQDQHSSQHPGADGNELLHPEVAPVLTTLVDEDGRFHALDLGGTRNGRFPLADFPPQIRARVGIVTRAHVRNRIGNQGREEHESEYHEQ